MLSCRELIPTKGQQRHCQSLGVYKFKSPQQNCKRELPSTESISPHRAGGCEQEQLLCWRPVPHPTCARSTRRNKTNVLLWLSATPHSERALLRDRATHQKRETVAGTNCTVLVMFGYSYSVTWETLTIRTNGLCELLTPTSQLSKVN